MSINKIEAGAFAGSCALRGLSTAEALAELARTTWSDALEDLAFGRRRHMPTIRRLAKPMLLDLDRRHAEARAYREAEAADRARFTALPAGVQATIRAMALDARGKSQNRRARDFAAAHGITVMAMSIERLRALVAMDDQALQPQQAS